uniref:Recep_L_domain domain-containing protein n=1 Tax=Rhabditophanes sp. KR3021 TaxID=114890 RepID=A0AC35TNZ4_9BILA
MSSLASKGLYGVVFNYTIITSGSVQFIGNIDLFPSHNLMVENNVAKEQVVTSTLWYDNSLYNLCSKNIYVLKTPGVTANSVTVVGLVPGMGKVAVSGNLFMSENNFTKIDRNFIQDDVALIESRKKVICLADWIVPANGSPVIVTRSMKNGVGC